VGGSIALREEGKKGITEAQEERLDRAFFRESKRRSMSGVSDGKSRHQTSQMYALLAATLHSPLLARVKKPRIPSLEGFVARVRSTGTGSA